MIDFTVIATFSTFSTLFQENNHKQYNPLLTQPDWPRGLLEKWVEKVVVVEKVAKPPPSGPPIMATKTLEKPVRGLAPVPLAPTPPPKPKTPPRTPRKPGKRMVSGAPWPSSDVPLFSLRRGWHLATDYDLQWIVYRRRGARWVAFCFPSHTAGIFSNLREYASDRYGTFDGLDPAAMATIRSWQPRFSDWLRASAAVSQQKPNRRKTKK